MLADLGCESIAVASRIGQAITLIEGHIFDAAMLDLNLNGTESYPIAYVLTARGVPYFFPPVIPSTMSRTVIVTMRSRKNPSPLTSWRTCSQAHFILLVN